MAEPRFDEEPDRPSADEPRGLEDDTEYEDMDELEDEGDAESDLDEE